MEHFLREGAFATITGPVRTVRREVPLGDSRLDFLVNDDLYLEVTQAADTRHRRAMAAHDARRLALFVGGSEVDVHDEPIRPRENDLQKLFSFWSQSRVLNSQSSDLPYYPVNLDSH